MNDVCAIVPGAGRASRIGGFFKELTPINVSPDDSSRFVVVSERMIALLRKAGASPIYFVVNADKLIISEYYVRSSLFSTDSLLFSFQGDLDQYYGMPFAIDKVYKEIRGKTVLMGMPDTLIEPDDSFDLLLHRFRKRSTDLELGLYRLQSGSFGGFVSFDADTGRILSHIDKAHKDFPTDRADNAWAIAAWGARFTEFLHDFVSKRREEYRYTGFGPFPELLFGDIIDAALADRSLVVTAGFVSAERGYYLDVTDPEKYFKAVLHYHVPGLRAGASPGRRRKVTPPRVFISHSNQQKRDADNLHLILSQNGFQPTLDSFDVAGGQEIRRRIEQLIKEADYFVLLVTVESLASHWVTFETTLAHTAGMLAEERFLPVNVEEVPDDVANRVPLFPRSTYKWLDGAKSMRPVLEWLQRRERERAAGSR